MLLDEPLIFERGAAGRVGWPVAESPDGEQAGPALPPALRRDDGLAGFPEVSELEVVRHFVRLSQWNYSAATTLYPLGSCTMKYNPAVNETLARLAGFAALHPLVPDHLAQGALEVVAGLEAALAAASGLDAVCLQPAQGRLDAARGRGTRRRAGRRAGAARGVPAGAAARAPRGGSRLDRGGAQERRPHAVVLRQLRRPGAGVCLHRPAGRGRPVGS